MSGILTESRQSVFDRLLKRHLEPSFAVIDYGCGPGYLAFAAGQYVRKVYGIDVSAGALECAGIVNHRENIQYLMADEKGLDSIPDEEIDAVYSFAVVQHMTDEAFDQMLSVCQKKLRPGGRLLLHIQLPNETWQTQADWEKNKSLEGQVKFKYGLHCFGRTEAEYTNFVERQGFDKTTFLPIADLFPESQDDLTSQRLLIAFK
jgi:cyclopropane fatty-acyl-phospholipid synthase-like methyltransferase